MKTWKILQSKQESKTKNPGTIVQILLENRNIKTKEEAEEFLGPKLESVTIKQVGIDEKEVKKALDLINDTIKEGKGIVIYGDYDVDGISATAILWETLYKFYKNVFPYIPHRVDEGYGLSLRGIQNLKLKIQNCGLIITVDNGIVANDAVEYSRSLGVKTIITDHHIKGKTLPTANAIIHTTELCGTGIAYLIAKEISNFQLPISNEFSNKQFSNEDNHLELVALATVADLVPLNKSNRTLLKFGLESLKKTKRPGLLALFDEAKIDKNKIGTYEIGHMIASRLNASGRITHALDSLRLICTTDNARAKKLAKNLNEVNRERQQLTFDSAENAISKIKNQRSKIKSLIFVEDVAYEQGVIGLIASKLVEEFYRPAIAVSVGEKISKGSARSVNGVNIIELIRSVPEFLSEAGGHPMAAGFSVETAKLELFKKALIKKSDEIDRNLFDRILYVDMELPWGLINMDFYNLLQNLSPFGMGNPQPVFLTKGLNIASVSRVGRDGNHLQILFEKDGDFIKGMKFKDSSSKIKAGDIADVVYTIELNEWNGNKKIELKVRDIKTK